MFGKKPSAAPLPKIVSLIDRGTRIEGNIHFCGGLQIDGEICGQVNASDETSALTVSEYGSIFGQVRVPVLNINGSIHGPVQVSCLEMGSKARIIGDVTYARIQIELGATIEGRMLRSEESLPDSCPSEADTKTEGGEASA
jgi:cytoskeletal protein CcmA (bactofilin family)